MERREEKEKKKKKKAALAFLLAFSSVVTSCTAIGVVFLKKQSLNETNNDITKVENEIVSPDRKNEKLKLSQIDLSKFKTTLRKVNKLNIDNFYKDYVEKLRKEKFEEYKAPLWKKYNQINDFYQKLILDKPNDILINADKKQI
ncbi:hypothetical protein [Mycoplasmopsis bovigenitalium]|uniref:hypothetical protein n=1 Tax=Mycoplasmopsis bovigenitalium TaxID=2112 RepID=UPI000BBB20D3|nr:hypothetical protein [Mycoplasmopsis bovigenitalium]